MNSQVKKLAGLALFYTIAFIALIALLTLPAHAADPGMDTCLVHWSIPTTYRDSGEPLPIENLYGYDLMHAQIVQNAAACFGAAMGLPDKTAEQSQAIEACFSSERIGEVDWTKITNATTTQYSCEYPIGETHAWSLRAIPMDPDNPGQPIRGGSAEDKDDNWSYWSKPVFKTMSFKLGAIETPVLSVD